ncbi:MAG TPA: 3'-5' exonuclease [Saprospiraceae bacterium]|nr:3'-5' exonuclease [Saprospiraceae bacterium]
MKHIIIDLEATCWSPGTVQYQQEIIELGACRVNAYMEIETTFSKLIRPVKQPRLSHYCKQLTGLRQEEIEKAKTFDVVLDQFIDWCDMGDESVVLYSWGAKDYELLVSDCLLHRIGLDWLDAHVDLKSRFARIKGLPKPYGLDKALSAEGWEFEGDRHRALPDALNLSRLFVRYFEEWNR